MLSGTFEQLLTYTGFSVILFSALAVLSLFFVQDPRQGHRHVPRVGLSVGAGDLLRRELHDRRQHDRQRARPAFVGLGVIAAGVPVYWWTKGRSAPTR